MGAFQDKAHAQPLAHFFNGGVVAVRTAEAGVEGYRSYFIVNADKAFQPD